MLANVSSVVVSLQRAWSPRSHSSGCKHEEGAESLLALPCHIMDDAATSARGCEVGSLLPELQGMVAEFLGAAPGEAVNVFVA